VSIEQIIEEIYEDLELRCSAEITGLNFDFNPDNKEILEDINKFKNFKCEC
jgi:hypothetical protein